MLHYIQGDATRPAGRGHKIIVHICNDIGGWGRGFVLALSERWQKPEHEYRAWASGSPSSNPVQPPPFELGQIQPVRVEPNITVINMVAQHDVKWEDGVPPIRYEALRACLESVGAWALSLDASVHMPRIGAGLAGGEWSKIEAIIKDTLLKVTNLDVFVYDLPGDTSWIK